MALRTSIRVVLRRGAGSHSRLEVWLGRVGLAFPPFRGNFSPLLAGGLLTFMERHTTAPASTPRQYASLPP